MLSVAISSCALKLSNSALGSPLACHSANVFFNHAGGRMSFSTWTGAHAPDEGVGMPASIESKRRKSPDRKRSTFGRVAGRRHHGIRFRTGLVRHIREPMLEAVPSGLNSRMRSSALVVSDSSRCRLSTEL